jgi:hypothetical protein
MSNIINIILLVALGVAIFFIIRRMVGKAPGTMRTLTSDPESQASYEKEHNKMHEEIILTLDERIELSWQFLNRITEQFLNLFSTSDKIKTYKAGQLLRNNGMRYEHNVEEEASLTLNIIREKVTEHNKNVETERSR